MDWKAFVKTVITIAIVMGFEHYCGKLPSLMDIFKMFLIAFVIYFFIIVYDSFKDAEEK